MKMKYYILFIFIFSAFQNIDSKNARYIDPDTLLKNLFTPANDSSFIVTDSLQYSYNFISDEGTLVNDSVFKLRLDSLMKQPIPYKDSLLIQSNSIFLPLVYVKKTEKLRNVFDWEKLNLFSFDKKTSLLSKEIKTTSTDEIIEKLRADLRDEISNKHAEWYTIIMDQLPGINSYQQQKIGDKPIGEIQIKNRFSEFENDKVRISVLKKRLWRKKATALFQFSQNYISSNWYQGGNSNLALLSILNGQLIYDNTKNILWENNMEWRAGFNSVEGDTLRKIATNDDLLRLISKFGIKAYKNWYYSASAEGSTQLFDNYKAINSKILKARLFTPVRVNVGIGMDYMYKKIISLMIAPISYKYIYSNDTVHINPSLFGILKGKNYLSEIGSSMNAKLSISPMTNWQLDSRFTFYTNYKKVETDLEIVNIFTINRFITARLMLNPRYDNTIILRNGEKSKIQFKQLSSIGLAFRLL